MYVEYDVAKASLDPINNDKTKRYISIKGNNGEVVKLGVELKTFTPLMTTPVTNIEKSKLFPVDVTTNLFRGYTFDELVMYKDGSSELEMDPNDKLRYTNERNALIQRAGGTSRYLELATIDNPVTKIDYSIIVDVLHKDMFIISGLKFLLDDKIDIDANIIVPHTGIHIGGKARQVNVKALKTVFQDYPYGEDSHAPIEKIIKTQAGLAGKTFTCYGISTTKDLSGDADSVIHPVTYQTIPSMTPGVEIQVARQDTVPIILLELGTIDNFTTGAQEPNVIPNFVLYTAMLNNFRKFYNHSSHLSDAVFSFMLPLY